MPTLAPYSNASSDVFPGGQLELLVQFENFMNSGEACAASDVTIGIAQSGAADSGTGTPVATTSAGIITLGTGLCQYNWSVPESAVPGSYLVTWTGTRASDSTQVSYTQLAMVAANPESVPQPGLYASVKQYRDWSGDSWTPAQLIQVKLQRASEDMDLALVAAVYRVNADGMPLDPQLVNVLARATSAQVQWLLGENDDAGLKRQYSSTSVGGVSATRAASQQGGALPRLCPRALSILRVEGVLPAAPLISW
jgi:hypothetical protein